MDIVTYSLCKKEIEKYFGMIVDNPDEAINSINEVLLKLENLEIEFNDFKLEVDKDIKYIQNYIPAYLDSINEIISQATKIELAEDAYEKDEYWDNFISAKTAAEELVNIIIEEEWSVNQAEAQVEEAIIQLQLHMELINKKPDSQAPEVRCYYYYEDLKDFYDKYNIWDIDTDIEQNSTLNLNEVTFMAPQTSKYDVMAFTHKEKTRCILTVKDITQVLNENTNAFLEPTSVNYIKVSTAKSDGVNVGVIYGKIDRQGKIVGLIEKKIFSSSSDVLILENLNKDKDLTYFFVTCGNFVKNGTQQAAAFTFSINDENDNFSEKINLGKGYYYSNNADMGKDLIASHPDYNTDKKITLYLYYRNEKGANDEGIDNNGNRIYQLNGSSKYSPTVTFSKEKTSDWFQSSNLQAVYSQVNSWYYVSSIINHQIESATGYPIYKDPNFGLINSGSFVYILDESIPEDKLIIEEYQKEKAKDLSSNNLYMNYQAATLAKEMLINQIGKGVENDQHQFISERFNKMKQSSGTRFFAKGRYDYTGTLSNLPNGTLVFVHFLERWGNVVNRIYEVTRCDFVIPQLTIDSDGFVKITEKGSGLKTINIRMDTTNVDSIIFENTSTQNYDNNVVTSSNNLITISGLSPTTQYNILAQDISGLNSNLNVSSNAEGKITLNIDDQGDIDNKQGITIDQTAPQTLFINNSITAYIKTSLTI